MTDKPKKLPPKKLNVLLLCLDNHLNNITEKNYHLQKTLKLPTDDMTTLESLEVETMSLHSMAEDIRNELIKTFRHWVNGYDKQIPGHDRKYKKEMIKLLGIEPE